MAIKKPSGKSDIDKALSLGVIKGVVIGALALGAAALAVAVVAILQSPAPAHPKKVANTVLVQRATAEAEYFSDGLSKGDFVRVCQEFSADFLVRNGLTTREQCVLALPNDQGLASFKGTSFVVKKVDIVDDTATVIVKFSTTSGQSADVTLLLKQQDNANGKYDVINLG